MVKDSLKSNDTVCDACSGSDPLDGWVWGSDGKPWCSECYRAGEA